MDAQLCRGDADLGSDRSPQSGIPPHVLQSMCSFVTIRRGPPSQLVIGCRTANLFRQEVPTGPGTLQPAIVMRNEEPTHRTHFVASLERCTRDESFIPAFYQRFLATSEEIREKFRDTDFEHQNQMLLQSLRLAAGATVGDSASLRELRNRAETHDRHHLNIAPRLYDDWLNAVIETARKFDVEWSDAVEESWRAILGHVIDYMRRRY